MARANDDTWSVTESVGQTAIQVAMGRMAETDSPTPLFTDPYAQLFVTAAIDSGWSPPFTEQLLNELTAADPLAFDRLRAMADYTSVRTRFFDDFLIEGARTGVAQTVIVAAGLDARAWRLDWPAGSTVFELDRPEVLAFKRRILADNRVEPTARYIGVGVDLRRDWRTSLKQNGFHPADPTMWIVEGLLPYISAADQNALFDFIDDLSARGSLIAVEAFDERFYDPTDTGRGAAGVVGHAPAVVDGQTASTRDLFYLEPHPDVADWLSQREWSVLAVDAADMMASYGRPVRADLRDGLVSSVFVRAGR